MTKPIFEPTPQRQVSALRYDKNQLQRRPAPRADPAAVYCFMGRDGDAQTIPNWADVSWEPLTNLTRAALNEDVTIFDLDQPGGQVNTLVLGKYLATVTAGFVGDFTGQRGVQIGWEGDWTNLYAGPSQDEAYAYNPPGVGPQIDNLHPSFMSVTAIAALLSFSFGDNPGDNYIRGAAGQDSGVDQEVDWVDLHVAYLGPLTAEIVVT